MAILLVKVSKDYFFSMVERFVMTPLATTQLLLYVVNLATVTFLYGLVDSNGVSKAITA